MDSAESNLADSCHVCREPLWLHPDPLERFPLRDDPTKWRCRLCATGHLKIIPKKPRATPAKPVAAPADSAIAQDDDDTPVPRPCRRCQRITESITGFCSHTCRRSPKALEEV